MGLFDAADLTDSPALWWGGSRRVEPITEGFDAS